jgi:hypothetical protein
MIAKNMTDNKYPTAYWSEYADRIINALGLKKTAHE